MTRGKKPTSSIARRLVIAVVAIGTLGAFVATLWFLYQRSKPKVEDVVLKSAEVQDVVQKTIATGSIVPRREVLIKPRVSGIIRKIYVAPGQQVKEGDLIAEIRIIPDVAQLNQAETTVNSARISLAHAERELLRAERAKTEGLTSDREVAEARLTRDLRKAELNAALRTLQVVREGAISQSDDSSNTRVRSTVAGTILEVPVEEGASVIESNNFNEGTSIATVADMRDMIFEGHVDEADVDKLRTEMEVQIRIGAIEGKVFPGKLEYIAPKGVDLEGAIQFEIKAALDAIKEDVVVRAGYSANAEIVLRRQSEVVAISEALLQFDGDKPYVEVESAPGTFERRDLKLGISDGVVVEVVDGLEAGAKIKHPAPPKS